MLNLKSRNPKLSGNGSFVRVNYEELCGFEKERREKKELEEEQLFSCEGVR